MKKLFSPLCSVFFLVYFMEYTKAYQLNITSISYPSWDENCAGFVLRYVTDVKVDNNVIKIEVNLIRDLHIVTQENFTCKSYGHHGLCNITSILVDKENITIKVFAVINGNTSLLLAERSNFIINIAEIRGPFHINVQEIAQDSFIFTWKRPLRSGCDNVLDINYIEEKCMVKENNVTCGETDPIYVPNEPSERPFLCIKDQNDVTKLPICSRTIKNLHPQNTHTYTIRWSLYSNSWSRWSNVIEVTTLSKKPKNPVSVSCDPIPDGVEVSWEKPPYQESTKITHFKLLANQYERIVYATNKSSYKKQILSSTKITISVKACTNSGCTSLSTGKSFCTMGPATSNKKDMILAVTITISGFILVAISLIYFLKDKCCLSRETNATDYGFELGPRQSVVFIDDENNTQQPTIVASALDEDTSEYIAERFNYDS